MIIGVLTTKQAYQAYTTDAHRDALWSLILSNVAYAGVGDAGGLQPSAVAGDLHMSLHTDAPGLGGDQTTNEVAYPGYARVAGARDLVSDPRWEILVTGAPTRYYLTMFSSSIASQFPLVGATGDTFVVTHIGIGTDAAGAGKLLAYAPLLRAIPLKEDMGVWFDSVTPLLWIY